ncbi:hypothetical protein BpHYR1_021432 [Brachionus plicatilis]|uniref:Uncharacterized protein n=1 Tax=Brachionus plicatilis TaxID=10195 RepID=A0A3M7SUJ1_BRAPC|nr:hypothetical protein BpHYR1_021432 [Brachionus plicatilis]
MNNSPFVNELCSNKNYKPIKLAATRSKRQKQVSSVELDDHIFRACSTDVSLTYPHNITIFNRFFCSIKPIDKNKKKG